MNDESPALSQHNENVHDKPKVNSVINYSRPENNDAPILPITIILVFVLVCLPQHTL